MSNPEDTTPGQPTPGVGPSPDAQPTEAYPPVPEAPSAYATEDPSYGQDAQPTAAYPPVPEAPAADDAPSAYAPQPTVPAYAPADYAQQPTAAYAPPAAQYPAPPAAGPDTRPKTLGWVSLGLAVVGLVLVLVSFIPMVWVSLVLTLVGGLLLLVALVLGIVTLANKRQGGKGLGIGAIIVSVLGGGAWAFALIWSLVFIGMSAGSNSGIIDTGTEQSEGGSVVAGGEEAYLAEVRPELIVLFQEIDPSITDTDISTAFPDEILLTMGNAILVAGDAGRDAMVDTLTQSLGDVFTAEQATRFYDIIQQAAENHLAG